MVGLLYVANPHDTNTASFSFHLMSLNHHTSCFRPHLSSEGGSKPQPTTTPQTAGEQVN